MMRSGWVFLSAALVTVSGAIAQQRSTPETLRYSVMSNSVKSGAEVDTFRADGGIDSEFDFNDRGRGPKVEAHWVVDQNGMPVRVDVAGVDYLKAPVDEHFSVENGEAHWKSTSENGSAPVGRFYSGVNTPQVETALLVRLLARAGAEGVPLYPSGVAHLEKVQEATVRGASGATMHVTEYGIAGFSFEPTAVWMDDGLRVFGTPGPWFANLREGWEGANNQLYELQVKAERERYQRLAQELTRHPAHPVAIEHVRLFDAEHATMIEDQTVVVAGDRISAVGGPDKVEVPGDAERIDGRGKTLLPGLFDMHVHLQGGLDGILHMASGVTSVRDMGNSIEVLAGLDGEWRDGDRAADRESRVD